jgi:hypothetical protein
MSVTVTTHIFCDVCNNWDPDIGISGVTRVCAVEARTIAKRRGWIRKRVDGRVIDICDSCQEKKNHENAEESI